MMAVPLTGETTRSYAKVVWPNIHPDTLIQIIITITKIINFDFMIVTWVAQLDNSYGYYVSDLYRLKK